MNKLREWNSLTESQATKAILTCCGSQRFASAVVALRPLSNMEALLSAADRIWWSLGEDDWLEAFACHPRIGESSSNSSKQFSAWSTEEQSKARSAEASILESIAAKNQEYEARHGFIYIVCASGRSADELLTTLERRLDNPTTIELREAAEQQRQITNIRLRKWFTP